MKMTKDKVSSLVSIYWSDGGKMTLDIILMILIKGKAVL
jgi:hypothetical protein